MADQFQTDAELLILFRSAETREKAFTAIVDRYKERLYWHIRRLVVTHDDTDDVLQNTFIKAWKGLENFRQDSQLFTWLYRVATNESITYLEKQKKMHLGRVANLESLMKNKLCAEEHFDAGRLEWKLQLAIQSLPPQQRIVFNLRYFDEMPYKQMSEILNVTEGALKASYHHAARKIEDFLINR